MWYSSSWLKLLAQQTWLNYLFCFVGTFVLLFFVPNYVPWMPVTFDTFVHTCFAEFNRQRSKKRVRRLCNLHADDEKMLSLADPSACICGIVGYREDLGVFRKCLESYLDTPSIKIIVVGIDGNEAVDLGMAKVTQKVFPQTINISLGERMGEKATRLAETYIENQIDKEKLFLPSSANLNSQKKAAEMKVLHEMISEAAAILRKHNALYVGVESTRPLVICLTQPHKSKKEIMFTSMIFEIALGKANQLEALWSSDSDTWVYPETVMRTVGTMTQQQEAGGSCSAMAVHNSSDSIIADLWDGVYRCEYIINRGPLAAVNSVDCLPGICAAFRLQALEEVIMDWFSQDIFGIEPVINDDRHLTTCLLLAGWKIAYNTETVVATDAPATLIQWTLQQCRWARATHIESLAYPRVYILHSPLNFIITFRRIVFTISAIFLTFRYAITGKSFSVITSYDFCARIILATCYCIWTTRSSPLKPKSAVSLIASQIFYQIPLPGISLWALCTVFEPKWGTRIRGERPIHPGSTFDRNIAGLLFVTSWMGFVSAACGRSIARWAKLPFEREAAILCGFVIAVVILKELRRG